VVFQIGSVYVNCAIPCHHLARTVTYRFGDSYAEELVQQLSIPDWRPDTPVRLGITTWSGGSVRLLPLPEGEEVKKGGVISCTQFLPLDIPESIVTAAAGRSHACLVTASGAVFTVGSNDCGQCGQVAAVVGAEKADEVCVVVCFVCLCLCVLSANI
jgi:hypothetical protein